MHKVQLPSMRPVAASVRVRSGLIIVTALLYVCALPVRASADTVWLKDGSIVKGEILELTDDELVIDTDFADELSIDIEDIDSLRSTRMITVTLDDNREFTGYLRKLRDASIHLSDEPPPGPAVPAASAESSADTDAAGIRPSSTAPSSDDATAVLLDLSKVHKMEQKKTYFWYESNIDVGVSAASGNSENSAVNISGAFNPHFGKNRVEISGQSNRQESDGDTTESNWRTATAYTRELTTRWGATALINFEGDNQQGLDLRTTAGAGINRVVLDMSSSELEVLLGLAYVHEQYETPTAPTADFEDERDFGALIWSLKFDQDIFTDDVEFYHTHQLTRGILDSSQLLILTTTGLDFDLIDDLSLKLELQFDHNSEPGSDADKDDFRYIVKLGYEFEGDQDDWLD